MALPDGQEPGAATPQENVRAPRVERGLLGLGLVLAGGVLIATLAVMRGPTTALDEAGGSIIVHYGWLSLVPALVAIALAFATRQVLVALLLGIAAGGIVYGFGSGIPPWDVARFPWGRVNFLDAFILEEIGTRGYAVILFVYLWSLGGLIGLWGRTGAARHFAERAGRRLVVGPRSAMLFAWLMGVVFHQGGTISTVLAGTTVRPLLDRHGVTKEEASYLVDSTASPVATVLPFNAWPLVVATVAAGTIPFFTTPDGAPDFGKAVAFFFTALPFNLYAWFAVLGTLLFALRVLPPLFGMKRARERAERTGALLRPGAQPLASKELEDVTPYPGYRTGLVDFLLPLAFLLTVAVGPFLVKRALGNSPEVYVAEAFFAAVVVAAVIALVKGLPLKDVLDAVVDGAKGVTVGAVILALAVALTGVATALGTGAFVASLLGGLPPAVLPALLLIAGMVTAFSTGSSFGTFAVLFPVALPLADALVPGSTLFLALSWGAVVSGSVYGDQCSPISDTSILASLATGSDLMDHVTTQIPYATLAAGLAAVLFLVMGFAWF